MGSSIRWKFFFSSYPKDSSFQLAWKTCVTFYKRYRCKRAKTFAGIRICQIVRIQAFKFFIRAIRKIRIPNAFSYLFTIRPDRGD
jgi:hypothetical protein